MCTVIVTFDINNATKNYDKIIRNTCTVPYLHDKARILDIIVVGAVGVHEENIE